MNQFVIYWTSMNVIRKTQLVSPFCWNNHGTCNYLSTNYWQLCGAQSTSWTQSYWLKYLQIFFSIFFFLPDWSLSLWLSGYWLRCSLLLCAVVLCIMFKTVIVFVKMQCYECIRQIFWSLSLCVGSVASVSCVLWSSNCSWMYIGL